VSTAKSREGRNNDLGGSRKPEMWSPVDRKTYARTDLGSWRLKYALARGDVVFTRSLVTPLAY